MRRGSHIRDVIRRRTVKTVIVHEQPSKRVKKELFLMMISEEVISLVSGKVTPAFMMRCADIVGRYNIHSGHIRGMDEDNMLRLYFTNDFPEEVQQRIRNAWNI